VTRVEIYESRARNAETKTQLSPKNEYAAVSSRRGRRIGSRVHGCLATGAERHSNFEGLFGAKYLAQAQGGSIRDLHANPINDRN
jgi:hypothetical protein